MRQRGQVEVQSDASDAELAGRAATGEPAAFEELYRRHVEAAWRVALAVTGNPHDAADAVSDAFTRVFQALPHRLHAGEHFLPYLLAAARNAAIDVLRRGGRQGVTDWGDQLEQPSVGAEPAEQMVAGVDAALVARAFRSLPERWRSVLWLTEVEGVPAKEVANLLGVSPNGVAQLAVRARAGLRQRYLQAHLGGSEVRNGCRESVDRLGAYAAGGLAPRDISKVDQHLAACEACRVRLSQLEELTPTLRRALLPLPVGLASMTLERWRDASTGAAGATAAGAAAPAGLGVGTAVIALPVPLVASLASVALLVAGIVGVGVVQHRGDRDRSPAPAVAAVADPGFVTADVAEHVSAMDTPVEEDDPMAGLVAEGSRQATDLAGLTAPVAGQLPTTDTPEVPSADPALLEPLVRGNLPPAPAAGDLAADLGQGAVACAPLQVLEAGVECQLPAPLAPAPPPPPLTAGPPVAPEPGADLPAPSDGSTEDGSGSDGSTGGGSSAEGDEPSASGSHLRAEAPAPEADRL